MESVNETSCAADPAVKTVIPRRAGIQSNASSATLIERKSGLRGNSSSFTMYKWIVSCGSSSTTLIAPPHEGQQCPSHSLLKHASSVEHDHPVRVALSNRHQQIDLSIMV